MSLPHHLLPPVAPHVVAEAVAALPARLKARLDAAVEQARHWPVAVTGDTVEVTAGEERIIFRVPVDAPEKATCSCLLSPKCLHRTAVLCCAPTLDSEPIAESPVAAHAPVAITHAQRAAARALWDATIPLLEKGIDGADAIMQAELLRAVHGARQAGLPRPAGAATAVVRRVRSARARDKGFRLGELTDDVHELLLCCHHLIGEADGARAAAARGIARRDYEPVGDLRLYGLFCEPVRTASGHTGAVTHLADDGCRVWRISDVRPGEPDRIRQAADGGIDIGEVRIGHRELSRAGLLASDAHASADGRLSHGRGVQAVRAAGRDWYRIKLWETPLTAQVARWLDALQLSTPDRPGGHDLAFLDGIVAGADWRGLLLTAAGMTGPVVVTAPLEDPLLPYVTNLRQLAENAAGQGIRLAARFAGPRVVEGLAFSAPWLPDRFDGHVALGIDRLQRSDLPGPVPLQPFGSGTPAPPLAFVRHPVERVVAAGRAALLGGVATERRRLAEAQLHTGAALVEALGAAGVRRGRDVFGRLDPHDTRRLARAWLAAAAYEQAAGVAATRAAWEQT